MSYRFVKLFAAISLGVYAFMGAYAMRFPAREMYPFFSWSLFSTIPQNLEVYTMEVHRIGVTTYDPPLKFREMREIFAAVDQSPTQYFAPIQSLGRALYAGESGARARARVESIFQGQEFEYSILRIKYDPVDYWRTGQYEVSFTSEVLSSL